MFKVYYRIVLIIIDVHNSLAVFFPSIIYPCSIVESISNSNTTISIPNWTCNDYNYIELNISHYHQVRSINIGINSFAYVKNLIIDGLKELKELNIGSNSFTEYRNSYGNDNTKSFHILNCESLESIQIGEYSFSDYAGEFELKKFQ